MLLADDTNILYSDANVKKLNNVVNTELDKLNTWFIINKQSVADSGGPRGPGPPLWERKKM